MPEYDRFYSPLTNLSHLDWLRAPVLPAAEPGHTTYRLDREPAVDMVWTYAECRADGSYRCVGGGRYDPRTGWYGQGAYNADDVARAAVVYLRHWRATGSDTSRYAAYQLLRGLAYLQTAEGPCAGNVVLWMQPDGTLNPSADPAEWPDPSDGAESFWLARTIWALGEGYAAFQQVQPEFAAFLQERLDLAVAALQRQSLARYGQWRQVDGAPVPAWLIADGADATGEALLGLAAFVEATGDAGVRTTLDQLARGVAAMSAGSAWSWPFGAVLPSALTPGAWHAWGGLAPAGLAWAYRAGGSVEAIEAALADAASFTPYLLVAGGPDNGGPLAGAGVQIAYGAQSRIESLLSVAACADRPELAALAGVAATWFFGNNPAGAPMYDPATGRTFDGIDHPGLINPDSGAESTIHGLLAMLALDANPHVAAVARTASLRDRRNGVAVLGDVAVPGGDPARSGLKWLTLAEPGTHHGTALVRSFADGDRQARIDMPGAGEAIVIVNDHAGRLLARYPAPEASISVLVPAGGFAIVRRGPG